MNKITCICCGTSFNKDKIHIHKLTNRHINNLLKEVRKNKINKTEEKTDDKFYEWFNEKETDKLYDWYKK